MLLVAVTACGRRATAADCRLIVDRSVELQLKELGTDGAADVAEREAKVREQLQDALKACEGKHVTEQTMACVQGAGSTQDLDKCLR